MRLSTIAAVVAGAGIAQVAATPIRIVIASPQQGVDPLDAVRFGHSVPLPPAVAAWKATAVNGNGGPAPGKNMRRPCHGRMSRIRQKGIEISNAFRKALGLPLIETNLNQIHAGGAFHGEFRGGYVSILPMPMPSTASPQWEEISLVNGTFPDSNGLHPVPHHRHHHRPQRHGFHGHSGSFANRLHHSLMHLGRWEGRAVAFVLGCGIGVLLRMFWVLAIVTYRAIKGQREDEHEYSHITIIEEYEDVPVHSPPPTYTYPADEKVPVKEDDAPKAPTNTEESK